jgi:hypothetical protein
VWFTPLYGGKKMIRSTVFALATLAASAASAVTIDTNATWDGNINSGWGGSGQSLTVDLLETHLDDISFYFADASAGLMFNFTITDALTGGNVLFSDSFTVASGINTFLTNLDLSPGAVVYALFDYNGFTGDTAHFSYIDGYAGGQSFFESGVWDTSFVSLDHRFIANFSDASPVPLPAGGLLLIGALGGLALIRRRKSA